MDTRPDNTSTARPPDPRGSGDDARTILAELTSAVEEWHKVQEFIGWGAVCAEIKAARHKLDSAMGRARKLLEVAR